MTSPLDLFKLDGRVALVTGSSAGIGEALARGLAGAGATVVINGRTEAKVDGVVASLAATGAKASGSIFDVTDSKAATAAIEAIERDVGPIDILINNAGIQRRAPLEDMPDETWREVIATNLDSLFYVSKAAARHMIPRRRGSIINICSVMSELGRATVVPYTAAKGGVKMLTKGMAVDWGKHGIRVNGIGPGYFTTELNAALVADEKFSSWIAGRAPLGRWGNVDELVGAAIYLASDAASFVTGHILYVDGGMTGSL
ncbi:MAG: SDR family oxidoreductase [Hyphomicrobiaceae bacterium]